MRLEVVVRTIITNRTRHLAPIININPIMTITITTMTMIMATVMEITERLVVC